MDQAENRPFWGLAMAAAAGFFWSISAPAAKILNQGGVDMVTVVFCRVLGSAAIFGAALKIFAPELLRLRRKEIPALFLFSLLAPTGTYLGYMVSLVYLPAATALVIYYSFPAVTALCSAAVTGERPSSWDLLGVALMAAGVTASVMGPDWSIDRGLSLTGVLCGFGAVLGIAGQTLWGRATVTRGGVSTMGLLFYSHLFGSFWIGLYKTVTVGWSDLGTIAPGHWALIAATVLVVSVMGYGVYYGALRRVSATVAGLMASVEIVFGVAFASVATKSWPTIQEITGCALIFGALFVTSWGQRRRVSAP